MIDPDSALVLEGAPPAFVARYLELVESADGDCGAPVLLTELADFVAGLVAGVERFRPTLELCLAALERVAARSEDAEELVVWSFFDNLSPDVARSLAPWLGPRTRALLDEADQTPGAPDTP